ncbi:MAG: alpha/beta hydrolase [Gammaproteobacteria bacterium]
MDTNAPALPSLVSKSPESTCHTCWEQAAKNLLSACLLLIAAPALFAAPAASSQQIPATLKTTTGTLYGSLELPTGTGPFPVALIIAGSGPTDRDGNDVQLGLDTDCYKLLAEALARNGIASLRYDKRGAGEDLLLALPESKLRVETYIGDAVAWGKQLRGDRRFSTLTVIGHSEGSLIGMLAAREIPANALVSIAGAGEPAQILILKQLQPKLPPDLYQESEKIVASLDRGHTVSNVPDQLDVLFRPSVQPYLISWFRYDPAEEFVQLKIPALIVQGERDLQVSVSDAQALAKADPSAKLVLIPSMNHVLKDVGPSVTDNLAAYRNPDLPLDSTLASALSSFILHLPPTKGEPRGHK